MVEDTIALMDHSPYQPMKSEGNAELSLSMGHQHQLNFGVTAWCRLNELLHPNFISNRIRSTNSNSKFKIDVFLHDLSKVFRKI